PVARPGRPAERAVSGGAGRVLVLPGQRDPVVVAELLPADGAGQLRRVPRGADGVVLESRDKTVGNGTDRSSRFSFPGSAWERAARRSVRAVPRRPERHPGRSLQRAFRRQLFAVALVTAVTTHQWHSPRWAATVKVAPLRRMLDDAPPSLDLRLLP